MEGVVLTQKEELKVKKERKVIRDKIYAILTAKGIVCEDVEDLIDDAFVLVLGGTSIEKAVDRAVGRWIVKKKRETLISKEMDVKEAVSPVFASLERTFLREFLFNLTREVKSKLCWVEKGRLSRILRVLIEEKDISGEGAEEVGVEMRRKFEKGFRLLALAVLYDSFARKKSTFLLEFLLLLGENELRRFLEVFSGEVLSVPSAGFVERKLRDFRIWRYIEGSKGREKMLRISTMASHYRITEGMVRKILTLCQQFFNEMGERGVLFVKDCLGELKDKR